MARPEDADFERTLARVEALPPEFVQDGQHVGRRHHDDRRLEIVDEGDLAFDHAAGDRNDGAAEALRAVVRAQAAGEQAIAIGIVQDIAGTAAGRTYRTGHQVRPDVDIAFGVADDGRLAGRSRGAVDARELVLRDGEHAERIGVAQVLLVGEWKF